MCLRAPCSAQPGDGHPGAAQLLLLSGAEEAQVAGERNPVLEGMLALSHVPSQSLKATSTP